MKKMILSLAVFIIMISATQAQTKFHRQFKTLALTESMVNGDYKLSAKKCSKYVRKHKEFKADTCYMQKLTETVRYNPDEFVKQEMKKEQEQINNTLN